MNRKFLVFAVLAFALILSACGPTTINQEAPAPARTLNVNGLGQVNLTPDIAYIYIGVHTEGATASEAVEANKGQTSSLISSIKKSGVDEKDIRTTNFSIWPSQQYGPDGTISGTVYMVDNTVYITVRELDGLGDLLDSAISAGANTINSIQFDVADKAQALKDARTKAVADAQAQAQELAEAAGVSLGEIQTINFYENSAYPVDMGKGGGGVAYDAASAVPIQPGQLTVSVNVNLTYSIK
ncbi:SIMPL domain-containing protein [Candidatus Villigracilis affinis]|uniref:SIMPL domain-containing protein n=1 Tax=Candidatus Villigracilis affinis TaxID=3140682 RepID=UPI001E11C6A5|nr:SIMPL domain-containing protein [Anaerolineales bacterium]MBL0347196.1 SIMPL domain-containing protein [Anaerolineales bacterium]